MLIRYRRSEDGRPVAKAVIYTGEEHRIDRGGVDPDALRIIERLRESGHEAYIVGGAVRDLILGRRPKDFDIVTDAEPPRIKRVFRSARVIGRRFRLVHVYAGPKIFEVSTFRSIANGTVGNEYGTMDEDAQRRDFTLNALYYDPVDQLLIDYVGGFKDIAARRIKPVIPLASIFREDPVRMIRCAKYAATSGCRIPWTTRLAIRRDARLLAEASPSRLTEEFVKILGSGKAAVIFKSLAGFSLLPSVLPECASLLAADSGFRKAFYAELEALDAYASDQAKDRRLSLLLAHFLEPFLASKGIVVADSPEAYRDALHASRLFLAPLNPPRIELEAAVLVIFRKLGVSPLQRPRRGGPERGRGGDTPGGRGRGEQRPRAEARGRDEERERAEPRPPREDGKRESSPAAQGLESSPGEAARKKRPRRRRKPAAETGTPDAAVGRDAPAEAKPRGRKSPPREGREAPAREQGGGASSGGPGGGRAREGSAQEGATGDGEARKRRRRRRRGKPSGEGPAGPPGEGSA